jgi:ADP-heptose:LPS heptosyltransferase
MLLAFLVYLVRKATAGTIDKEPKKILVLYLSGIGDIICLDHFYRGLKERFPDSLVWACFPAYIVKLQQGFFPLDGYIPHQNYKETLKLIDQHRFDLLILPGWVLKDSLLALLSNARAVLGFINDRSFTNRFVNSFRLEGYGLPYPPLARDMRNAHLSERPSPIAQALGMSLPTADGIEFARTSPAEDYIVFHASSRLPSKRWDPGNFAAVADHVLSLGLCVKVILIGDSFDRAMNEEIIRASEHRSLENLAGKLSLDQTRDLIAKARLFLGNDSGPMHIAALSGVPTLGLLGPYPPEICRPLGSNSRHIFHRFECTGCNPGECSHNYRCMKAIRVEEVTSAVESMLAAT